METDRIVEFRVLSEELNFRRAASRLAMSQSSLSRHIDNLEYCVGFRLFTRDRHNVTLTPEGVRFLSEVSDLPERLLQAIESSRPRPRTTETPLVRLGYGRTRGLELIERALLAVGAAEHPIEVALVQTGSAQAGQSLLQGEVDLALIRPPVPAGVESRGVVDELLGVVMREDDSLAASATVSLDAVLTHPFISVRSPLGIPAVDSLTATIRDRDLMPRNVVSEADSITSMLLLIESGLGIGLAREAVFRRANTPGLVIRTIAPSLPGIPLHLAWRKDDPDPAVTLLIDLILQCRSQLGSGYRIVDEDDR